MPDSELSDEQLQRYSRHLLLPQIDLEGQQRITQSKVAIIGVGGLGSPAALYLTASGIGNLTIVDHDNIDLGNLQRQITYTTSNLGESKTRITAARLGELNPETQVQSIDQYATPAALDDIAHHHDIVIDASDNFATRFAINRACHTHKTALVSGSAIRFQGQISVFNFTTPSSPCYRCLYSEESQDAEESCSDRGIFAPLTGIIGSMQAAEALKLITGAGTPLSGTLLTIDALTMKIRTTRLPKDPKCPLCGGR